MIILNIYTHNHINYKLFCIDKYINKCKERVDVDKHLNSVNSAELLIRFQSPTYSRFVWLSDPLRIYLNSDILACLFLACVASAKGKGRGRRGQKNTTWEKGREKRGDWGGEKGRERLQPRYCFLHYTYFPIIQSKCS